MFWGLVFTSHCCSCQLGTYASSLEDLRIELPPNSHVRRLEEASPCPVIPPQGPSASATSPRAADPPPREESLDIIPGGLSPPPISTRTGGKVTSHSLPHLDLSSPDLPSTTSINESWEKPDLEVEFASLRRLIEANSNHLETRLDLEMRRLRSEFIPRFDQLDTAVGRLAERVEILEQGILTRIVQTITDLLQPLQLGRA